MRDKMHDVMLDELRGGDKIDWWRAAVDSSTVRAVGRQNRSERPS